MPPATMMRLKFAGGSIVIGEDELPSLDRILESPPCSPIVKDAQMVVFQPDGHPKQAQFDDEIWPPIFKPEFVRSAKRMRPRDTDVFVCTYPKCGTTWIQHICSQLMLEDYGPDVGRELCVTSPMIERMGAKFADNVNNPRLLKSHFTYKNMPKSSKSKYIFACRNPKDCLTSYYHHNRNFKIYNFENGDFDTFFELFAAGKLGFGDYFEHLASWLPHLADENVLFLIYEDMCADLTGTVKKIAKFLGGRAAELCDDETELARIVEASSLKAMKQNQSRWFPEANLHRENFIRKGGSGDWRNYFTAKQSDQLDAIFQAKLGNTVAAGWWTREMRWNNTADVNNNMA